MMNFILYFSKARLINFDFGSLIAHTSMLAPITVSIPSSTFAVFKNSSQRQRNADSVFECIPKFHTLDLTRFIDCDLKPSLQTYIFLKSHLNFLKVLLLKWYHDNKIIL